jgi:6-phosphogluconate dehydrogenase
MGISGGEEGARHGPSLMLGGSSEAFAIVEHILSRAAAPLSADESCIALLGPIGAGNYVKMLHNGIEYADMQLIAEVYSILKQIAGLSNDELSAVTRILRDVLNI